MTRYYLPAWTGPDSPQSPVPVPENVPAPANSPPLGSGHHAASPKQDGERASGPSGLAAPHCDRCGSRRAALCGAYGGLVCRDVFACWQRYQRARAALCLL